MNNANTRVCTNNTQTQSAFFLCKSKDLPEILRRVSGDGWPFIHAVQTFIIIQISTFLQEHPYTDMSIIEGEDEHFFLVVFNVLDSFEDVTDQMELEYGTTHWIHMNYKYSMLNNTLANTNIWSYVLAIHKTYIKPWLLIII